MYNDLLPLFPLKVVLFPGMALPLHVFEERYKAMINHCIEAHRQFGVVLVREGEEVGPGAVPERIGTLARIRAVERLDEGKINLITEGTERFRLLDYLEGDDHYLMGMIEPVVDEPGDPDSLQPLADDVKGLFLGYLRILLAVAGQRLPACQLPEDAVALSFMIASVLQAGPEHRQDLLEMTDTAARLERERGVLERETERLAAALKAAQDEPPRPFTAKLDGITFGSKN